MKYLRVFLIISLLLCPTLLRADIYRSVGEDGVVCFTNRADDGGELYLREARNEEPPRKAPPAGSLKKIWTDYADKYSRTYFLPPALAKAVMKAESNGNRRAVSRKGAMGSMQLMPFTSKRFNVEDPFDPIDNIEGGIKYLRELLTEFRGDIALTAAAYNAGPGAVKRYGGVPPYPETRVYVRRVMEYYRQYSISE